MTTRNFKLFPIDPFDVDQELSPWVMPGVGTRAAEENSLAEAEVWAGENGTLLTRFSSCGYFLHFEIKESLGNPIKSNMQDAVAGFLSEMLEVWVVDGVDDDLECNGVAYI
ncbi:hypothetical protein [Alcanivorax sp. IL2]|uniref:hypothetical protein n=1 Tax=Alcanivorax sp. IL2 TaxID=3396310 RepID=UPI0039C4A9BC